LTPIDSDTNTYSDANGDPANDEAGARAYYHADAHGGSYSNADRDTHADSYPDAYATTGGSPYPRA
jgi:hypothetical protein